MRCGIRETAARLHSGEASDLLSRPYRFHPMRRPCSSVWMPASLSLFHRDLRAVTGARQQRDGGVRELELRKLGLAGVHMHSPPQCILSRGDVSVAPGMRATPLSLDSPATPPGS